jgi:hypothetical protein
MREICTSGSVGGEGRKVLTYPAKEPNARPGCRCAHPGYAAMKSRKTNEQSIYVRLGTAHSRCYNLSLSPF